MANSELLLISANEKDIQFCSELARQISFDFKDISDPTKAAHYIADYSPRVIFADGSNEAIYQDLEGAIQEIVGIFSDRVNPNYIHWISGLDLQDATFLLESPLFGHYVNRRFDNISECVSRYAVLINATLLERAFEVLNLVKQENVRTKKIEFTNTTEKQDAVEAVKNFLLGVKFKSRMASVISNAVDELLMNAMFDAPVDEFGNQTYVSTPRSTELQLSGKSKVELEVAWDGEYVAIMARDYFGSLDKQKLFSHISKRYIEEEYKVKAFVAGAGIGLATVFRSGGSFFFSSDKSERTEVTVFFKLTNNFREFKDQFRFISTQFYF